MPVTKSDPDLFEALVTPQLAAAHRFAYQLVRNEADAEDLLQEACGQAFEKFYQFQRGTNFKAWFFRIIRNRYIDIFRRRKKEPGIEQLKERFPTVQPALGIDEAHDPLWMRNEGAGIDNEEVFFDLFGDEVNRFLAELPPEFRIALVLCDVEGFSYLEISQVLDCPIGTVRSRISRARSHLKEKLYTYARSLGYVRDSIS